jgi:hypothetical protein
MANLLNKCDYGFSTDTSKECYYNRSIPPFNKKKKDIMLTDVYFL